MNDHSATDPETTDAAGPPALAGSTAPRLASVEYDGWRNVMTLELDCAPETARQIAVLLYERVTISLAPAP